MTMPTQSLTWSKSARLMCKTWSRRPRGMPCLAATLWTTRWQLWVMLMGGWAIRIWRTTRGSRAKSWFSCKGSRLPTRIATSTRLRPSWSISSMRMKTSARRSTTRLRWSRRFRTRLTTPRWGCTRSTESWANSSQKCPSANSGASLSSRSSSSSSFSACEEKMSVDMKASGQAVI